MLKKDVMSDLYQSLSHSRWDWKYHVVFVPNWRRKVLFGKTRRHWGEVFDIWARRKSPGFRMAI
jgi:putative transposase